MTEIQEKPIREPTDPLPGWNPPLQSRAGADHCNKSHLNVVRPAGPLQCIVQTLVVDLCNCAVLCCVVECQCINGCVVEHQCKVLRSSAICGTNQVEPGLTIHCMWTNLSPGKLFTVVIIIVS